MPHEDSRRPLSLDQFLDRLPLLASIVGAGERLKNASQSEIQAWAWGIEDATNNVRRLITEWKAGNG